MNKPKRSRVIPEQPMLFDEAPQPKWQRPKGKGACTRDPERGPGSCWHWWDGCPNAERRGCHLLWLRQTEKARAEA